MMDGEDELSEMPENRLGRYFGEYHFLKVDGDGFELAFQNLTDVVIIFV